MQRLLLSVALIGGLMIGSGSPAAGHPGTGTGADPGADTSVPILDSEEPRPRARVRTHDGIFERGCQSHGYRYRVHAPDSDWALELFLLDPRQRGIASAYKQYGATPARGRDRFEFCSAKRPGRYTIKARLTWSDPGDLPLSGTEERERWLKPRTFQLRRR